MDNHTPLHDASRNPFDSLVESLHGSGLDAEAGRLHSLLHEQAWTSSSEMVGEVGLELRSIKRRHWRRLDGPARQLLQECAGRVHEVWPRMKI